MLVMNMSIMTAIVRQDLSKKGTRFQFWYNQLAVISLPISNTIPITAIDNADAENIAINPTIEQKAATALIPNAVMSVTSAKTI